MNTRIQRYSTTFIAAVALLAPNITMAAVGNFKEFIGQVVNFFNLATAALVSLAIVFFFWSVVRNLWGYGQGNTEDKEKLQQSLFWGVIIIFIMVSLWGIIAILQQTLRDGFY